MSQPAGLLTGIESAVNEQRYGDIAQYFHENARITTINQEVMTSTDDIEPYFDRWFGEGGYLKTQKMTLNADALTGTKRTPAENAVIVANLTTFTE